jgi:PrsW family intramembrane metalloprotease
MSSYTRVRASVLFTCIAFLLVLITMFLPGTIRIFGIPLNAEFKLNLAGSACLLFAVERAASRAHPHQSLIALESAVAMIILYTVWDLAAKPWKYHWTYQMRRLFHVSDFEDAPTFEKEKYSMRKASVLVKPQSHFYLIFISFFYEAFLEEFSKRLLVYVYKWRANRIPSEARSLTAAIADYPIQFYIKISVGMAFAAFENFEHVPNHAGDDIHVKNIPNMITRVLLVSALHACFPLYAFWKSVVFHGLADFFFLEARRSKYLQHKISAALLTRLARGFDLLFVLLTAVLWSYKIGNLNTSNDKNQDVSSNNLQQRPRRPRRFSGRETSSTV